MLITPVDVTATINPADYVTPSDKYAGDEYRQERYEDGLKMGRRLDAIVYISITNSWTAQYRDPAYSSPVHVTAYEILGNTTCSADMMRGWIAGGARILSYREAYRAAGMLPAWAK